MVTKVQIVDSPLLLPGADENKKSIARDFQGIPCVVEYEEGDYKVTEGGNYIQNADYGYVVDTLADDGEGLDVFFGPNPESKVAFVIALMDREDPTEKDEDKLLLGFDSAEDAIAFFTYQYYDSITGPLIQMSVADAKEWTEQQAIKARKIESAEESGLMLEIEEVQNSPTIEVDTPT